MKTYLVVDPPSGWRYGFPKYVKDIEAYTKNPAGWFKDNGYPKHLIKDMPYVRSWYEDELEDVD